MNSAARSSHPTRARRRTLAVLGSVAVTAVAAFGIGTSSSSATSTGTNRLGVVCTTDAANTPTFDLETSSGYIYLPDGNSAYMLGYAVQGEPFQHPSPVLCVKEGDTVTVRLHNTYTAQARTTSIMFPGQGAVSANGAPAQPDLATKSLTTAAAPGATVSYTFVATNPGTYLYQSGTDPELQVRAGLFGALVVRPAMGDDFAYDRADSRFTPGEEFLSLLSEIDPYLSQAVENNAPYNMANYKPRYWLVNGRGFPDSIADNFASWMPSQPYGALARVHPYNPDSGAGQNHHPYPALTRYLSVGSEDYPFHPHGNNGSVIGRDGNALEGPNGEDLSAEKFVINVGPGQTWDVLSKWYDAEKYDPTTNPVPVTVPQVASQTFGMFYSGSPYLGTAGALPPGGEGLNQCGEFYILAHNHSLNKLSSWGVNMTGPVTFLRVDPPLPNTCA